MKKTHILMLSLVTFPVMGKSILATLNQHQNNLTLPSAPSSQGTTGTSGSSTVVSNSEVSPSDVSVSSSTQKCEENDQTSLPLAYVTSLIQQKDAALDITHDPRSGSLSINAPDMISNCSSMLQWTLKQPTIEGKKSYAVEVKIKSGDTCTEQGCTYKVSHVENGEFKENKDMIFKPTLKGFEECLQKSGVVADGKVNSGAIYSSPVNEKFSGLNYSGKLLFLSHGPSTPLIKAKYGKFEHVMSCDYYEAAHPQISNLLTLEESENERLKAEAEKLKNCKVEEYHKVSDFLEKYQGFSDELTQVRDRLIIEAAKKSAQALTDGKYTDEDLKVLADFEKYIVNPKIDLAHSLYEQSIDLEGDARKQKQNELKLVLAEISSLNKKPYFLSNHVSKLLNDGKFEEAELMNSIKLTLDSNRNIGSKVDGVVITPKVANNKISSAKADFSNALPAEKERFEYKTGQQSGKASYYADLASRMRKNSKVRTENYHNEIKLEFERIQQPNGYCYKYWRNTQKCIQDTTERIQELHSILKHYNSVDEERALEYDQKSKEYGDLESQGRRYLAAQDSEDTTEESKPTKPAAPVVEDTTKPAARAVESPGVYNFDFNPGQNPQQQAQVTPQQYQYPMNPYQQQNNFQQQANPYAYQAQQQYNPWLGQQAYPNQNQMGYQAQMGYSFNLGGGMQQQNPYMQPQQQGYWQQPYQSYNMYSMYGR